MVLSRFKKMQREAHKKFMSQGTKQRVLQEDGGDHCSKTYMLDLGSPMFSDI